MSSNGSSSAHIVWAVGHLIVLLSTSYSLIRFGKSDNAYYLAYAGAITSWGIVVYKSLGIPKPTKEYFQRALVDENVQYLILAGYFVFFLKPIFITTIPFAVFSLFHTLTYVRTTYLPKPAAVVAGAPIDNSFNTKLYRGIATWVKKNYEQAMLLVSFVEVVFVFGRLLFGAILFKNSFLAPLVYAHFLRLRFYLSQPTRQVFAHVSKQVHDLIDLPACPALVKRGVIIFEDALMRYSESILSVPGAGPNGPGMTRPPTAGRPATAARPAAR